MVSPSPVADTAALTAQNTFTEWLHLRGAANLSISGVNGHTVTLQRRFSEGAARDVTDTSSAAYAWTADTEIRLEIGHDPSVEYRAGVKTGDFGTGTVTIVLSQA